MEDLARYCARIMAVAIALDVGARFLPPLARRYAAGVLVPEMRRHHANMVGDLMELVAAEVITGDPHTLEQRRLRCLDKVTTCVRLLGERIDAATAKLSPLSPRVPSPSA